jgi:hypothetical protein
MEEFGLQGSEGMGLDPTINDNRGDKGGYLQHLQSHHDFLKIFFPVCHLIMKIEISQDITEIF